MARFDFETADYEAPMDFEIIPEGTEVRMKCTEAEEKETSSGGTMIAATFQIVEGEYKGRKVWTNFNVVNKSEKAQNFGRRMVSGWARACGKPNANDTDQLLEKPFWCKLGIEKGSGPYKDKNIISSFLMPEGASSPAPTAEKSVPVSAPAEETPAPKKEAPKVEEKKAAPAGGESKGKRNPWDD